MTVTLKIASAQLNSHVGSLKTNIGKAYDVYERAKSDKVDILVLPEQFIIGYPAEDLVLKPSALRDCKLYAEEFAKITQNGPAVVFNLPWVENNKIYNSVLFMRDGIISDIRHKHHLPNYGVFDEFRIFESGGLPEPIIFKGVKIGLPICEDLWRPGVASYLSKRGAEILISPNGSPWRRSALSERTATLGRNIHNEGLPLVYVNQIGGQDELVFDGSSFSLSHDGKIVQALKSFVEDYDVSTWIKEAGLWICAKARLEKQLSKSESDWRAITLGLADYVNKNKFQSVLIGLSGGLDSAAVAAIAVDALGPNKVWCVMMPSVYTSDESLGDAQLCISRLGCRYDIIPIKPAITAYEAMFDPLFKGQDVDLTEENLQSRARAIVLMGISNKFGPMVVTTGNKSEMAVGYATLYGDMCGGFNPIKDIYKSKLFEICEWRNNNNLDDLLGGDRPIPSNILNKPPSAELRLDQKDSDSLPDYKVLDDILFGLIELELTVEEIVQRGHTLEDVKRIQHLLYVAEYKRRQAPPGVKIGIKNFGKDRRYPITNGYRDASHYKDK
ncbi:NAD+ synthase [Hellea sp.]|nr:NAD+ synthase [Hellea sp.]